MNKSFATLVTVCIFAVSLSACQLRPDSSNTEQRQSNKASQKSPLFADQNGQTLKPIQIKQSQVQRSDLTQLRDTYAQLTPKVQDPQQQQAMQKRLASLEMLIAEQKQEQGLATENGYFQQAIQAYRDLQQSDLGESGEHISYQLSRALELQGNGKGSFEQLTQLIEQYPNSQYLAEAHFRQGEYLYAQGQFQQAVTAYELAVNYPDSDYLAMAAYMLGWTQFKLDNHSKGIQAFGQVLDKYLGTEIALGSSVNSIVNPSPNQLKTGEQRLVNDSIHIMSLMFSYANNQHSLLAYIEKTGERHYHHLLFDGLAQLHLNNDRYKDSALAYLAFAKHYPNHTQASDFYVKHIDAYILGKFPSLVLPAKQGYVEMFGVNGPIWPKQLEPVRQKIKPFLRQYINELSQFEHAKAQLLAKKPNSEKAAQNTYAQAARWYQEYIDTFTDQGDEKDTLEKRFLLAESLHDAGQKMAAIKEFERYAYGTPQGEKAAEAAYAAILTYAALLEQKNTDATLEPAWLNSQLKFTQHFASDPRATDIGLNLMQHRFAKQEYAAAIELANWLLMRPVNAKTKLSASLVAAHSLFATEQFPAAESAYQNVLAQLSKHDKTDQDMLKGMQEAIRERKGVSIYRQGELAQSQKKLTQAIDLWQRIVEELPNTQVRLNAQYDAATLLLEQKLWPTAIKLLTDFAQRFPNHQLTASIPDKLIYAFEQDQQWQAAADALFAQWQQATDKQREPTRLALWTAAEYYKKAGLRAKYLPAYRQYAHTYPKPFDTAMEARFLMSEFYLQSKEDSKRRYWLNKMIQADKAADKQRTVRSQYLAAMSSMVFAQDANYVFHKIKLTLPLKASLTKKRQAMDSAMAKFDQVLAYGMAEFSTQANYQVAELFRTFSMDLMQSQRPKGLSELELEQYDFLLEEQAYPFEEQAIELHESNIERSWQGNYDVWVQHSIEQLAELLPVRYNKVEVSGDLADELL